MSSSDTDSDVSEEEDNNLNPVVMDGRSFRDVSLGDTLEELLRLKCALTRRELLNLPDEVPTPPSTPPSDPSPPPPPKRTLRKKKKITNLID